LKIQNPEYDAQSKTRLTGPNTRVEMSKMVSDGWAAFARKNKEWLEEVLERAIDRHHTSANKKAIKDHQKTLHKKVPGLVDATSKSRFNCQVLVTEGLSAASMITEARDPVTTGSFPLTGKINNVYGNTPAQILQMGKITNLLAAIGLVPGKKASRGDLHFGKVVIATDADYDGSDIFTLLVNLFYTFWPELFDQDYEAFIYRLVAPNVALTKGKKRVHFTNREQYEKAKNRYKGWNVNYYKGLGSMVKDDWEMILSGKTDTLIPITDDGKMKETLELLFGPSADNRKVWLQE
jgi:DNA gyrase/topoisomerase IV subunit B